jgi:homoserine O-acetyltransferase
MVERILPFEGSAKCSRHNYVFLESVKAALTADAAFADGWYEKQPDKGLRAAARVYAGWGLSQTFCRHELDISVLGYRTIEDFLVGFWEGWLLAKDANNLLGMLWTWQHGDISDNEVFGGDIVKALSAIRAKAIIMPSATDLYFPVADNEFEVKHMPNAELRVVDSVWGHFAGGPGTSPVDIEVLDRALRELLAS